MPRIHPQQHRIDLCNRALEALQPLLPQEVAREIHENINFYDEWGLGMEHLISYLLDFDQQISLEQFQEIHAAMEAMHLEHSRPMLQLRALISTEPAPDGPTRT
jgi:hypothetical protein